ncbi:glutamate receptor ionotropic, delta-2-like isoform X1 [Branchiostoma lanceolatum]|uniref:glutamate receptor ionotropic, delta-2-like isoform X1 n=1 Tax=Branchiostoma lanceolatum TaxID=7740 RepID=UPI003452C73D
MEIGSVSETTRVPGRHKLDGPFQLLCATGTVRDYRFTIYITKRKRPAVIPSLPESLMKPIIQTLHKKPASLLALFLVGMLLCDAFPQRANGPPVNATVGLPAPRTGTSVVAKLEEPSQTKNGTAARSRRNSSRGPASQVYCGAMANTSSLCETLDIRGPLRVVTVHEPPFIIREEGADGQLRYKGFCIDMLHKLADMLGICYTIELVPDGKYGAEHENNTWNGIIGEVMDGNYEMGLGPITISSARETVVDFTKPFMEYGTGLLMRKPEHEEQNMFAFLMPFELVVWMCILVAMLMMGFLLFATSRLRYRLGISAENIMDNDLQFNIRNSMWFAYWSLVKRGGEPLPRSMPARILAGFWWLFALVMVSTYTANLTAFLTIKRLVSPIKSIEDLAAQDAIPYGVERDVFLYNFFRDQQAGTVYERIWNQMNAQEESVFVESLQHGIEKARSTNYVFMDDDVILEYITRTEKDCKLILVRNPFLLRGYGIATQRNSKLTDPLSISILKLAEDGSLGQLKDRWWPKDGCSLDGSQATSKAMGLGLNSFKGVFFILLAGVLLACLCAVIEIVWHKWLKRQCWFEAKPEENSTQQQMQVTTVVRHEARAKEEKLLKAMMQFLRGIEEGKLQIVVRDQISINMDAVDALDAFEENELMDSKMDVSPVPNMIPTMDVDGHEFTNSNRVTAIDSVELGCYSPCQEDYPVPARPNYPTRWMSARDVRC